MLSIEDRFVGAYMWALSEALHQTRARAEVDAKLHALSSLVTAITTGGISEKTAIPLIESPIIFTLRYHRDPASRIHGIRRRFLDCSSQSRRIRHDQAILRSAYLAELLEGKGQQEAREFVLRQYDTGFLFTSHLNEMAKDGLLLPLAGDERAVFHHVPLDARMFSAACDGAQFGLRNMKLVEWQQELITSKPAVKDFGSLLFRAAYGYL